MNSNTVKIIRLSKVAKEFNVGLQHVVEFLESKGITVESSPNAKLSMETYEILKVKFQPDKLARIDAKDMIWEKLHSKVKGLDVGQKLNALEVLVNEAKKSLSEVSERKWSIANIDNVGTISTLSKKFEVPASIKTPVCENKLNRIDKNSPSCMPLHANLFDEYYSKWTETVFINDYERGLRSFSAKELAEFCSHIDSYKDEQNSINEFIRNLLVLIVEIKSTYFYNYRLNKRSFIRSIIHFLFKCLDIEPDINYSSVLFSYYLKGNLKLINHEKCKKYFNTKN